MHTTPIPPHSARPAPIPAATWTAGLLLSLSAFYLPGALYVARVLLAGAITP